MKNNPTQRAKAVTVLIAGVLVVGGIAVVYFSYFIVTAEKPVAEKKVAATAQIAPPTPKTTPPPEIRVPQRTYIPTPNPLKAIYMSQCVVGTPSFRNDLVALIERTELNAVVIDIKDYTGKISFTTDNPLIKESVSDKCGATDMPEFLATLARKGIYTIGRITVFQDPFYTVRNPKDAVKKASNKEALWSDNKGLHFIDVGAKNYWNYIVALSIEAHAIGFDEINYDYIRFPSDGPMQDIYFPHSNAIEKPVALEEFFQFLKTNVRDAPQYKNGETPPVISADLFGMTTTNKTDMNIGQQLERALPYFDYIAPMVYPSHYPPNFNGFNNPNDYPYELIAYVLAGAVERTESTESTVPTLLPESKKIMRTLTVPAKNGVATSTKEVFTGKYTKESYPKEKIRPWLQDFDYGGTYDVAEVKAQIQATYDVGLTSWMLWAPSNRYTEGALSAIDIVSP